MWEEKMIQNILQILLARQETSFGKCLRAFFRIISTFELDRKLTTTITFLIVIPKQWGHKFQLYFMCSVTNKPQWRQHGRGCSQAWASADKAEGAVVYWGRLLKQGSCGWKGSHNQNSFDSEQGTFGLRAKFRVLYYGLDALLRAE